MTTKRLVHGVVPPMITVFDDREELDVERTRAHVRFLIENGVHAIAPSGSTGEFISLSTDERKRLIDLVVDEAGGRVPVYAGTAHYSTRSTVELSRYAEKAGADGVMVIPPYYLNPPKRDAMQHYRELRDAISIPTILYNNPWFAGYQFTPWEVAGLVEEDVVHGIKCAHGDVWEVHTLKSLCGDALVVYYGHDINGFEALLAGADGWLTGLVNLLPRQCVQLFDLCRNGNLEGARSLWSLLLPLVNMVCVNKVDGYPHFVSIFKEGLNLLGHNVGSPRRPLTGLREAETIRLKSILESIQIGGR